MEMTMCEYLETATLVAVLEGNDAQINELLGEFLPGELREFADVTDRLADHIRRVRREGFNREAQGRS
jgi:hypothetical protein